MLCITVLHMRSAQIKGSCILLPHFWQGYEHKTARIFPNKFSSRMTLVALEPGMQPCHAGTGRKRSIKQHVVAKKLFIRTKE